MRHFAHTTTKKSTNDRNQWHQDSRSIPSNRIFTPVSAWSLVTFRGGAICITLGPQAAVINPFCLLNDFLWLFKHVLCPPFRKNLNGYLTKLSHYPNRLFRTCVLRFCCTIQTCSTVNFDGWIRNKQTGCPKRVEGRLDA
jgi:hypothetical protein